MNPACPTECQACLLCDRLVGFVFTTCLCVFTACPAIMLLTQELKTGRLSVLNGSFQVRSVMLTTGGFAFKYGQLVFIGLSGGGVLLLNQDRMASFSRQEYTSTEQDGSVTDKP